MLGEPAPFRRQLNRLARRGDDQAISIQATNDLGGRHVADTELLRQRHDAAFTIPFDQLVDGFDVVLGRLRRVVASGAFESLALLRARQSGFQSSARRRIALYSGAAELE